MTFLLPTFEGQVQNFPLINILSTKLNVAVNCQH